MPKNNVTDPITDQEMAFAHLVLSGTMTDRRAAEAVGLNPATAGYAKSKPRVRAFMAEHRTAVREKLVQEEAEGLRNLNIGRDQILARLWELATLNPEATRGSIAGQIRALAMIVAIEELIPGRRPTPAPAAPAASPNPRANIWTPDWLLQQRQQDAEAALAEDPIATIHAETGPPEQPGPQTEPQPSAPHPAPVQSTVTQPAVPPERANWVPAAVTTAYDIARDAATLPRMPFSPMRGFPNKRR